MTKTRGKRKWYKIIIQVDNNDSESRILEPKDETVGKHWIEIDDRVDIVLRTKCTKTEAEEVCIQIEDFFDKILTKISQDRFDVDYRGTPEARVPDSILCRKQYPAPK